MDVTNWIITNKIVTDLFADLTPYVEAADVDLNPDVEEADDDENFNKTSGVDESGWVKYLPDAFAPGKCRKWNYLPISCSQIELNGVNNLLLSKLQSIHMPTLAAAAFILGRSSNDLKPANLVPPFTSITNSPSCFNFVLTFGFLMYAIMLPMMKCYR